MSKTPEQLAEEYTTTLEAVPLMHYLPIEPCRKAFLAGYKAAQEEADTCEHILDMSKMVDVNGWISVKDRLPEGDETVILFGRRMLQRGFFVEPGHRSEGYMDVWVSCEWDGCGGYEEFE
jgi:hypothetical protein